MKFIIEHIKSNTGCCDQENPIELFIVEADSSQEALKIMEDLFCFKLISIQTYIPREEE